jgi:hypothetical protein
MKIWQDLEHWHDLQGLNTMKTNLVPSLSLAILLLLALLRDRSRKAVTKLSFLNHQIIGKLTLAMLRGRKVRTENLAALVNRADHALGQIAFANALQN